MGSSINNQLQQLLDQKVQEQNIPGVVLGITTPDGSWFVASGVADLKTKRTLQPTDRFRIGSVSKMFVAVVVLQLAQEEILDLDDTIATWLEAESDRIANAEEITIRQLLNHTSGLTDYLYTDEFKTALENTDSDHIWQASEVLEYVYDLEPEAQPGGHHSYCNTNYILLERIVEIATDNTLAQETRSRILKPLNLGNTFTEMREKIPGGFVHGYSDQDGDGIVDDTYRLNEGNGLGDGGLISTAADLIAFAKGLFQQQVLLKADFYEQMLTYVDDGEGGYYGLGVSAADSPWGEALGHSGLTGGFVSTLWYIPDDQAIVAVLVNDADHGDPDDIVESALMIVLGEPE